MVWHGVVMQCCLGPMLIGMYPWQHAATTSQYICTFMCFIKVFIVSGGPITYTQSHRPAYALTLEPPGYFYHHQSCQLNISPDPFICSGIFFTTIRDLPTAKQITFLKPVISKPTLANMWLHKVGDKDSSVCNDCNFHKISITHSARKVFV